MASPKERGKIMTVKCVDCSRVFDLLDENDAGEWFYGHDCEKKGGDHGKK